VNSFRSSITLALALVVYAAFGTGIGHAFEHGHAGGEPGHVAGHPDEHWGGPGHEHWDGPGHEHWGRPWGWHGVDVERWHGGRWFHGEHLGRLGWWWIVGDGWYSYAAPVYPYPDPYAPPTVAAPATGYWYYCPSAGAYYPYVTECPEAWQPAVPQAPAS
jgi:hypothetical protein